MRSLSNEEEQYLDSLRNFCEKEIRPYAASWDTSGEIDSALFRKAGALGYLGLNHPEEVGGSAASMTLGVMAQLVLAEAHGSSFFTLGASAGLFGYPVKYFGSESQKKQFLPDIIRGEKIGCLAVTEPGAGSDVNACASKAIESGDHLNLSGQKTFITNAPIADYAVVLAHYVDAGGINRGLTHMIVDLRSEGVSRGKPMKKMGLKSSPTGELFFEDVKVPKENILGRIGGGFRQTMQTFNLERLSLSTWCVGVMNASLKASRQYSRERIAFDKPIYRHAPVAELLAEMFILTKSSTEWLMNTVARVDDLLSRNKSIFAASSDCAALKLFCSMRAREVTNLAVQIHGGSGYIEETEVCRLYQDIRLAEIGGGTNEIQKQIIARGVLQERFLD